MKFINFLQKLNIVKISQNINIEIIDNHKAYRMFGIDSNFKIMEVANRPGNYKSIFKINYFKNDNNFDFGFIRHLNFYKHTDIHIYSIFNFIKFKKNNISYEVDCEIISKLIGIKLDFKNKSIWFDKNNSNKVMYFETFLPPISINTCMSDLHKFNCKITRKEIILDYDNCNYDIKHKLIFRDEQNPEDLKESIIDIFIYADSQLKNELIKQYNSGGIQYRLTNKTMDQLKGIEV